MLKVRVLAAAAAFAVLPQLAHAEWYAGFDAGINYLQDATVTGASASYKTQYDIGYGAIGQVGYGFGPWKVEGELGYRTNEVKNSGGGTKHPYGPANGTVATYSVMANVLYEFMQNSRWHPFIGAGAGVAKFDVGDITSDTSWIYRKGEDTQLAYQGIMGVGYDLNDRWTLKGQYRYFGTLDAAVKDDQNRSGLTTTYQAHEAFLGFTYHFGGRKKTQVVEDTPAAAPAPAPKPAAAQAKTTAVAQAPARLSEYNVYFAFDSSAITAEGAQVIEQAIAAAKAGKPGTINCTGHSDRAGSEAYNLALSKRRAQAVKDRLVAAGIPASQISVVGRGERDLPVPTKDGVKEAKNRVVQIVLP
jgi:outer membrane protein OmpA-like peptidoglycan-associated protein